MQLEMEVGLEDEENRQERSLYSYDDEQLTVSIPKGETFHDLKT
jgi:hypothetical protein